MLVFKSLFSHANDVYEDRHFLRKTSFFSYLERTGVELQYEAVVSTQHFKKLKRLRIQWPFLNTTDSFNCLMESSCLSSVANTSPVYTVDSLGSPAWMKGVHSSPEPATIPAPSMLFSMHCSHILSCFAMNELISSKIISFLQMDKLTCQDIAIILIQPVWIHADELIL